MTQETYLIECRKGKDFDHYKQSRQDLWGFDPGHLLGTVGAAREKELLLTIKKQMR